MKQIIFKKLIGAKILSEANDLKYTVRALAKDTNVNEEYLQEILAKGLSI